MSAWTITGFESAANLAEETRLPEQRVPFAIVSSEIFSVVIGFVILLGFTLAIPSLDVATKSGAPFAYIMDAHFPHWLTRVVMAIILVEIYACALANLTMLGRIVWAMARDRQLPASPWFAQLSDRKVPANAMWLAAIAAGVFTWWAKFETVIAASRGWPLTVPTPWLSAARCGAARSIVLLKVRSCRRPWGSWFWSGC